MIRDNKQSRDAIKALKEGHWIFLTGLVGSGKTELAKGLRTLFHERIKPDAETAFTTVSRLFRDLALAMKDEHPFGCSVESIIEHYESVYFLILDDIGKQKISDYRTECLAEIINSRYEWNKGILVITSNLNLDKLGEVTDDSIVSRIVERSKVIETAQTDFRIRPDRGDASITAKELDLLIPPFVKEEVKESHNGFYRIATMIRDIVEGRKAMITKFSLYVPEYEKRPLEKELKFLEEKKGYIKDPLYDLYLQGEIDTIKEVLYGDKMSVQELLGVESVEAFLKGDKVEAKNYIEDPYCDD